MNRKTSFEASQFVLVLLLVLEQQFEDEDDWADRENLNCFRFRLI